MLASFDKKPKTETASFDASYFRNLSNIHVDAARVHGRMHGYRAGPSVDHPRMHTVVHKHTQMHVMTEMTTTLSYACVG